MRPPSGQENTQNQARHSRITWPRDSWAFITFTLGITLVSHYSAIGDTISCDAPFSTVGPHWQAFPAIPPPLQGLSLDRDRPFVQKKWGCSSDSLWYHRKHSATGVLRQVSRDRGGISVRVTKGITWCDVGQRNVRFEVREGPSRAGCPYHTKRSFTSSFFEPAKLPASLFLRLQFLSLPHDLDSQLWLDSSPGNTV